MLVIEVKDLDKVFIIKERKEFKGCQHKSIFFQNTGG